MKIKCVFSITEKKFETMFTPGDTKYLCGFAQIGGLTGAFWRNPDGKPVLEIRDGGNIIKTIDVPTGCNTLGTFKRKLKSQLTTICSGELFEAYCRAEKFRQMAYCLTDVMAMMRHAGRGYAFLRYNPCAEKENYTDWQWEYHKMHTGAEYIEVRDEHLDLLHVIDVTGTSVMYSMAQLTKYLADNY